MIVQRDSAILGLPGERACPINANHRGVCKFDALSNPNYIMILDSFQAINERLIAQVRSRTIYQLQQEIE